MTTSVDIDDLACRQWLVISVDWAGLTTSPVLLVDAPNAEAALADERLTPERSWAAIPIAAVRW